jgi:hypothetical protein
MDAPPVSTVASRRANIVAGCLRRSIVVAPHARGRINVDASPVQGSTVAGCLRRSVVAVPHARRPKNHPLLISEEGQGDPLTVMRVIRESTAMVVVDNV